VPAHEAHKVRKALASSADAVILDLEDAVPSDMKDAARAAAARAVEAPRPPGAPQLWVRIDAADTVHFDSDLAGIDWRRADGIVLAKAEESAAVAVVTRTGVARQLLLVETVSGLNRLSDLVAAAGLNVRLAVGTWDLARDLELPGIDDPDESELIWHVRCEIALASRWLKLEPPVDGVFGRLGALRDFEDVCVRVRRLGFGGKLLVHPEQIPIAARVFGVDPRRRSEAQEIIAAYEQAVREGRGAAQHKGMLVDRAHVERARKLLAKEHRGAGGDAEVEQ
jgi:citrate lyase beta subunit